jgi:hypothetical protein
MGTRRVTRRAASAGAAALAAAALATAIGSLASGPDATATAPGVASSELDVSGDGAVLVSTAPFDRHLYSDYL